MVNPLDALPFLALWLPSLAFRSSEIRPRERSPHPVGVLLVFGGALVMSGGDAVLP